MRLCRSLTAANRSEVLSDVAKAPLGWRVTIEGPVRTGLQNRLMWALLQKVADQVEHHGRKYDAETWKCIFMKALGKELDFVPSLDGEVVALGYRSSELSKEEMSDLVEVIYSEGAKLGVHFDGERIHEPA